MKKLMRLVFWTPRIVGILFVLFISIFALDVFDGSAGMLETLAALFIHLIPSILLAVAVGLAWRWEWIGAVLFIGFAVWYVTTMRSFPVDVYLLLSGIPLIVGLLFAVGWFYKGKLQ